MKKKRRRSSSSRGRRSSRLGFIDKTLLMQIAGVTAGAVVPPLLVGKFAPTVAKTPTGAAAANIGAGVALAFIAEKLGQRDMAKAIVVGAGASGLSGFVSNAITKATTPVKGFITAEQMQAEPAY